ncbi:hypothetical protein ACFQ4O_07485 [Methylopila musalis]|uniref:Uncharacterized protein n=1 Tax=Methylopila musalis TaxID=1134781 RepID=A0ABW3Z6J4_9HYPH
MNIRHCIEIYQFLWSLKAHSKQRLAWEDAAQARIARDRAEAKAAAQLEAMLIANPSGQLGRAKLDDDEVLKRSGLL